MKHGTSAVSIYIHWPFCTAKCPYCDFNSHVSDKIEYQKWEDAYLKEISNFTSFIGNRPIKTVYFGGGTPSTMPTKIAEKIIKTIYRFYTVKSDAEITLEANPNSADAKKFKEFSDIGINRVSVGVQSLEASRLKLLGRNHNSKEAIKAIEIAAKFFSRYSFDLIYATPGQTKEQWERELRYALNLVRDHISLYQLTIEPGTKFHQYHKQGKLKMPSDDLGADLFCLTQEIMDSVGMAAYEVSNHSRPGKECQHNLQYWRYCDYIGIGPGAHSRIYAGKHFAITMAYKPEHWLQKVIKQNSGIQIIKTLSQQELITEYIMMGMRLREGINKQDFYAKSGAMLEESINMHNVKKLEREGLVASDSQSIKTTKKGFMLLNGIILDLVG
ncbi:coproporphyrinogen III oxidase [Rickettsiales bacterium]|nr:coproporphyrinogen III oxidase [Rickettsiales bacterium]